jgi:hypothetical protein
MNNLRAGLARPWQVSRAPEDFNPCAAKGRTIVSISIARGVTGRIVRFIR